MEQLSNPPLLFDQRIDRYNTEILLVEQLEDPDASSWGESNLDPQLSDQLLRCLQWTGPKNPLNTSVHDDRGSLGEECEQAYRFPYLVVLRTTEFDLPEVVAVDGFVVGQRDDVIRGRFRVDVRSQYTRADLGRGPWQANARSSARSMIYTQLRCDIERALLAAPRAQIVLEQNCRDQPASLPALDIAR